MANAKSEQVCLHPGIHYKRNLQDAMVSAEVRVDVEVLTNLLTMVSDLSMNNLISPLVWS